MKCWAYSDIPAQAGESAGRVASGRLNPLAILLACSLPAPATSSLCGAPQGEARLGELITPARPVPQAREPALMARRCLLLLKAQWLLVKVDGGAVRMARSS